MRYFRFSVLAVGVLLSLSAFTWYQTTIRVPELPETPDNYANIAVPNHLNNPPIQNLINTPDTNQITDAGATLGRVLFYETALSGNRTVSCGSCHLQEFAFTDTATFSVGFEGGFTGRNSMALTNAKYYGNGRFFWDERALSLEHQVLQPIQDLVEMGLTLDTVEARIAALDYYPELFFEAFGDSTITSDRMSLALAQFVRSMVSYESKYDVGRAMMPPGPPQPTDTFPNFTPEENMGMQLFFAVDRGNCAACHTGEMFVQPAPRNNGLDTFYTDLGLYNVTGDPDDIGKFKMGSLRNVFFRPTAVPSGLVTQSAF
ncbi:MAG: cytochrome-c peroxidase, partial [Bacteroidota bacterium]